MKTTYTDEQLQASISEAFRASKPFSFQATPGCKDWEQQSTARLVLARALLDHLPEPDNTELETLSSFFGRASIVLHQLDGLGDNGDTENFIERLQKLLGWKCTDAEKTAVESLMQSQGLTALQVLRQALRHYQMAVQGKPEPTPPVVDGKTPGQKADDSSALGTPVNAILADIRKPAYVGYMTDEMPADPYAELKAAHAAGRVIQQLTDGVWYDFTTGPCWSEPPNEYRIKPTTFTAHGKTWTRHTPGDPMPCNGATKVHVLMRQENEGLIDDKALKASGWLWNKYREDANDCEIIGWRYADEPTPPKLIPLDINDIRATDEFRLIDNDHQICAMLHANDQRVKLALDSMNGTFEYATLAKTHLRRQHGSTEWKPCTKEETK